ncbi:hypothetical protein ACTWP5_25770 [Streptomyces sp. 4N509B]|uniref:hypothetical protein n=1 Tax=Streptomyces sp. 4N509B TaxID=3457413 RepID=UPI003FD40115
MAGLGSSEGEHERREGNRGTEEVAGRTLLKAYQDARKAKAAAERQAKLARTEVLKVEAVERTTQMRERIQSLEGVLLHRPTSLYSHRTAVENAFNSNGPDGLVEALGGALAELPDSESLRGEWRAVFAPETRELVVEMDLPGQEVVPAVAQYRFKATAPAAVVPQPRKEVEVKQQYSRLVARLALRAINEVLAASPPSLVDVVAFNDHVRSKNRATGKAIRPCLVSVRSSRATSRTLCWTNPRSTRSSVCATSTPSFLSTPTTSNRSAPWSRSTSAGTSSLPKWMSWPDSTADRT